MLEQVLAHPKLVNLRGVALEVDTKPIQTIVGEFCEATKRFGAMVQDRMAKGGLTAGVRQERTIGVGEPKSAGQADRRRLQESYVRYAQIASGQKAPTGPEWRETVGDPIGLHRYIQSYLPHEILYWGGELREMFPDTCRALAEADVALSDFVAWWFGTARATDRPYDFFLLKIERFLEFVTERTPDARVGAEQEGDMLRQAYAQANDVAEPVMALERAR
jgi:hypothetical protein